MKKISFLFAIVFIIFAFWFYQNQDTTLTQDNDYEEIQTDSRDQQQATNHHQQKNIPREMSKTDAHHEKPNEKMIPKKLSDAFSKQERQPSSLVNFFSDERIDINERAYLVSRTLRSIPSRRFNEDFGNVVYIQSGYTFFESSDQFNGLPTLFDSSQNSVVVLTGRVLLKNINQQQAQSLSSQFNTPLDSSMAHLNIYAIDLGAAVLDQASVFAQLDSELELIEGGVHAK
ncbi:MAG: hypothetical protein COW01_11205 [Bdellovibrionales bacterium CG12_big_fil_rev_8_21_14_0_65_38_15]|nr:MAG: hypothetical protein COW79_11235 [Bdellovibrionales bacterium CG22_combo_CG10-13_8_21_14_all_38_13]PIQ54179.1 MAG: hypothetical protein COW01_11205 [Bdellovibrionales bacterium CG12_big_fil_rev_8_21_14_0_65_38_15]PIR29237.1 MAG: hypothetical protein COV38_10850 [Bdellovibrionales bacterium CG11_big_fil_rev_8_21_14_0_20_38_13]